MSGRLVAPLLVGLVLLSGAAAAGPLDTKGHLSIEDALIVHGPGSADGSGLLEVSPPGDAAGLRVPFGRLAGGWVVDEWQLATEPGVVPENLPWLTRRESNETLPRAGGGAVERVRCAAACVVALFGLEDGGRVGAHGVLDGALAPARATRHLQGKVLPQGFAPSAVYTLREGALETPFAGGARPWVSGPIGLLVANATFDLATEEWRRTLEVHADNETVLDADGRPVAVRARARYAVLLLDDAGLELPEGAPFRLTYPDRVRLRMDGALSAPEGSGELDVAGRPFALDRQSLRLEGDMLAWLRSWPPSRYYPTWGVWGHIEGDMRSVAVDGVRVASAGAAPAPEPPILSAAAAAGTIAGVGLVILGRLLVPLYSRLRRSDVLLNANRRRIHDEIRRRPGLGVGEIVAAAGLARVLVRHHLRVLEAHGLVVATRWRRRVTYAAAGDKAGRVACELKDATRRRVAEALVAAGSATQKDLVARLGLSQRLVSYHLARLNAASLVRVEGRNPRAYLATRELAEALGKGGGATAARARPPRGTPRATQGGLAPT